MSLGTIGRNPYRNTPEERLREAAYTSPSGTRITFEYTSVRRSGSKRGTLFEFAGIDQGYVQQRGFGSRQYPIRAIFSGDNHDLRATQFEAALYEPGHGLLEHPRHGQIDVVPNGDISRSDDLVSEVNQSIVEVTFFTSLKTVYPASSVSPKNEILEALDGYSLGAAEEFAGSTDLTTAAARATTASTVRGMVREVSSALTEASDAVASVRRDFAAAQAAINGAIDVLVGQPLLLARQLVDLVLFPSRALGGIADRLNGYANLATSVNSSAAGSPGTRGAFTQLGLSKGQRNDLQVANVVFSAAVAGQVSSVLNTTFSTRPEALSAAAAILASFDDYVAWKDSSLEVVGQVDVGSSYQSLYEAVALAAGHLIEISFTLVPERRITLDRARTIIDLAAEIYGTVDERLDLLITSNKLSASEVLELPRGKQIVYYP